jgi:excisionase family DNA binding protein
MDATPPLFRPSQLARFWELHPRTVYLWIREGKLNAVRTPGDHFRLRVADVRAFCAARGLPVPPFAREGSRCAYLFASAPAPSRALRRALRSAEVDVRAFDAPLDALFAAVTDPPALLVLDAATRSVRMEEALRALRRSPRAEGLPLLVMNVASTAKADALVRAGATRAIARGREREIAAAVATLVA